MKKTLLLTLGAFLAGFASSQCSPPTSVNEMSVNNIEANLNLNGSFWIDQALSMPGYEVPQGSGKHTIYSGALWFGGLSDSGQLHLAAQLWGSSSGNDYWTGPIDDATGAAFNCPAFDQFYIVAASEIQTFISTGSSSASIDSWPAKGNPNLSYLPNQDLAPFVDVNSDGLYNPSDGDFPKIKGDVAYWWVMNDVGGAHTVSSAEPFGMEIHVMAYAYATSDSLNNMTFYELKLINKSLETRSDTYFGMWLDPDLGFYGDDYVGVDTSLLTAYVYNGDSFDEDGAGTLGYGSQPPVQGITFSSNPTLNMATPIDLASFMAYGSGGGIPGSGPTTAADYYSLMKGTYSGVPLLHPTTGDTTTFIYPDNPMDGSGWSECSISNPPGDRRFLMSFGPADMLPGDDLTACFGLIYLRPDSADHCDGPDEFLDLVANMGDFCSNLHHVGMEEKEEVLNFEVFPNPASHHISIAGVNGQVELQLCNTVGQIVLNRSVLGETSVSVAGLQPGIYLLRLFDGKRSGTTKVIIE